MNKDVLYISPEDDITDVVQKIEAAKNRIIALVPPVNPEIFHSLVNMKLILKTAKTAGKTAVLVTTDASIINLAASLHLPVAKDLKSAPTFPNSAEPKSDSDNSPSQSEENPHPFVEKDKREDESISSDLFDQFKKESTSEKTDFKTPKTDQKDQTHTQKEITKSSEDPKPPKNAFIAWILDHKKTVIFSSIAIILLIIFAIWAIVFAPAANITIDVKTTSKAFSSNVTFTTTAADEDVTAGKFYLEEKKIETPEKIEFEATGSKNIGDKASGSLDITISFGYLSQSPSGSYTIPANSAFTYNGLKYLTTEAVNYSVSSDENCSNYNSSMTVAEAKQTLCLVVKEVAVVAAEVGEKYNIPSSGKDWTGPYSDIYSIQNSSAISGGSDKIITVVSEADVEKAKESLTSTTDTDAKKSILSQLSDGSLAINSSFKKTVSEVTATPAIGEEVAENVTPSISVTTTLTINYVDSVRIEEFIRATAQLASDQKIYSTGEPFIENFSSDNNSGKLKTTYTYGPKITAEEILEKVKGKKVGEVKALLNSINGISSTIETSFFWVSSIPNDPNKITVTVNTKETE